MNLLYLKLTYSKTEKLNLLTYSMKNGFIFLKLKILMTIF